MHRRKNLPPGRPALPVIGDTIAFALDPFGFVARRTQRYGPVFKTKILGRNTIVITGPSATGDFIDAKNVKRHDSMPDHIQRLFGGTCLPLLDGIEHAMRKRWVLEAFSPQALASYLPAMQEGFERDLDAWAADGDVTCIEPLKQLALATIARNVVGVPPGPLLGQLLEDYAKVIRGMGAIPVPLPGFPLHVGLRAKDRIFGELRRIVAEHRASRLEDGLARMLTARSEGGESITDEHAVLELHHIHLAGYVVFALAAWALVQLAKHPTVKAELEREVRSVCPTGPITATHLRDLPALHRVVMEVKRSAPVVPAIFGTATPAARIGGYDVPEGWMLLWSPWNTSVSNECFTDPLGFEPERFAPGRAEHERHEHAFVPQGAGPATGHKCAGADYSTAFMKLFLGVLLRDYHWELPRQDLEYDRRKFPPEPRDGLRVRISRRPRV